VVSRLFSLIKTINYPDHFFISSWIPACGRQVRAAFVELRETVFRLLKNSYICFQYIFINLVT
jgi:hypothetical protein